jgi:hypothetical protein
VEERTFVGPSGGARTRQATGRLRLYLSTEGRVFQKLTWSGTRRGTVAASVMGEAADPGQRERKFAVEGRRLVQRTGGQGRDSFTTVDMIEIIGSGPSATCRRSISYRLRPGQSSFTSQGGRRGTSILQSARVVSSSCRIVAGNAVGE